MPDLPVGTLTFLFTDIEGSTKLNQQHDDVMTSVLARHDALIEECVEQHEGTVVRPRGEGDSRFAVFSRASNSVAAASAIQQVVLSEPWPDGISLRVRMALHAGEADLINGDYRGTAVDRCARLRSIGYGGQTLLSQTTYDLVRDNLPKDVSLRDLGSHRLKDLQRSEQVFQLLHPALPSEFPPLKSLGSFPNNLPIQPTSFIGREREIAEVKQRLANTRLLTLIGAGGCGKTRLSLQVAADLLEDYPEGVWLVELAALTDPTLVPQAVASALGVREEPGRSLTETLTDFLKSRSLLLVLDNCEHLVAACAHLATALLRSCPNLRILATSREALGIAGETMWLVPSLSVPSPQRLPTLECLTQFEAVRLFIERATAIKQDFTVTNQNAPAVAQVCHRLDGIPLAIELAAARVKMMSVEQINARLDNQFRLLTGGSRTALPRQQTLRAAIDWSYDLLSESERSLLCRLSVFAGGWTLEAAEAVCADETIDEYEVLDLLTYLVDKSLVVVEEQSEEVRYRFLESIRQYSRDKLVESGEAAELHRQHRDWFLALAEQAEPELLDQNQTVWLERLETEHDNLRAVLEWSESGKSSAEAELRLTGALWRFWYVRGYLREGREHLMDVLSRTEALEGITTERAIALNGAGVLAYAQGDYTAARSLHEQSLVIRRDLGDKRGITASLNNLGIVAEEQGDYEIARSLHEQSLAVGRELGDQGSIADSLNNLGAIACRQGDYETARSLFEESLTIRRQLKDKGGIADALNNLGIIAQAQGDDLAARSFLEESLAIARQLGDKGSIADSLNNLGFMICNQEDYTAARSLFEESLAIRQELGDQGGIADSLNNLGMVAKEQGDDQTARSRFEESLTIRRQLGDKSGIAASLEELGFIAKKEGNHQAVAALYGESLTLFRELEHQRGIDSCLEGLAAIS